MYLYLIAGKLKKKKVTQPTHSYYFLQHWTHKLAYFYNIVETVQTIVQIIQSILTRHIIQTIPIMQTILADNTDYADYTGNTNNIVFQILVY